MALTPHPSALPDGPIDVDAVLRQARLEQGRAMRQVLAAAWKRLSQALHIPGGHHGLPAH